jgi:phosphohistidine phosphatase
MKTLHIVRHGKALQDYRHIRDDNRPLTEKGILNNMAIAQQLRAQYPNPGLIISSYAARALHTAHNFAQVMGYPLERVQVNEKLYSDGENEAYRILKNLPDELDSVMIVGHNPDVTFLANRLAACNIYSLPTSGVVSICFETDRWSEIETSKKECTVLTDKEFLIPNF